MTDTITRPHNLRGIIKYLDAFASPKGLRMAKKLFILFASLLLIAAVIILSTDGINLSVTLAIGTSALLYVFANRCETMLLKLKVNKWLLKQNLEVE